jgi:hypothetical protein
MVDTILITKEDFKSIRKISTNVDLSKLNPYILEAQELDLKPILGQELYYDLIEDFNESPSLVKYYDLFHGSSYTCGSSKRTHNGLIPVLCYFAYSRYALDAGITNTASGFKQKNSDYSENISEKSISRISDQARSAGAAYMNEVIEFLNNNKAEYPIWKCTNSNNRTTRITAIG